VALDVAPYGGVANNSVSIGGEGGCSHTYHIPPSPPAIPKIRKLRMWIPTHCISIRAGPIMKHPRCGFT